MAHEIALRRAACDPRQQRREVIRPHVRWHSWCIDRLMHARTLLLVRITCGALAHVACDRHHRDVPADTRTTSAAVPTPASDAMATPTEIAPPMATDAGGAAVTPMAVDADVGGDVRGARDAAAEPALPSWVPRRAPLTIVQAPDLYRNLGLPAPTRLDGGSAEPSAGAAP